MACEISSYSAPAFEVFSKYAIKIAVHGEALILGPVNRFSPSFECAMLTLFAICFQDNGLAKIYIPVASLAPIKKFVTFRFFRSLKICRVQN